MKKNFTVRQGALDGVEAFLSVSRHRNFRRAAAGQRPSGLLRLSMPRAVAPVFGFGARGVPDRDVDRRSRHGGSVCREADQPFDEAFAGALAGLWPQPSRSARRQARRHRRRIAAADFRPRRTRPALVDCKSIRCPFILDNRFYLDNVLWSAATSRAARSDRRLRSFFELIESALRQRAEIFRRSLQ
jgi:hypothetical protein